MASNNASSACVRVSDEWISSHREWEEDELARFDQLIPKVDPIALDLVDNVTVMLADITRLAVDAIVNAANRQGLGCFQPSHTCLDNTVHRTAGPRLRMKCRQVLQGHRLRVAEPFITPGFNLPAKHIIHVCGPNFYESHSLDIPALQACYLNCIDLAAAHGCSTIAFPCISCGLFGYTVRGTAAAVLQAVRRHLTMHADMKVVFAVFSEDARFEYLRQLVLS